jgi:hypothetical protein
MIVVGSGSMSIRAYPAEIAAKSYAGHVAMVVLFYSFELETC